MEGGEQFMHLFAVLEQLNRVVLQTLGSIKSYYPSMSTFQQVSRLAAWPRLGSQPHASCDAVPQPLLCA